MAKVPHQDPLQDPQVTLQGPLQDPQALAEDRENPVPKKSKGRQKVNMAKMENESNLQVTFSKRRSGLFKKASELVTLCGIELALIVFSPGKKAFSFGHPGVDNIIDRFLTRTLPRPNPTDNIVVAQRNENLRLLNMQLTNAQAMLEAERQRGREIDHARVVGRSQNRWEAPMEELSLDELLEFQSAMETLKVNVAKEVERLMQEQQQNPSASQTRTGSFRGGVGGEGGGGRVSNSFGGGGGGGGSSSFEGGGNVFPPFPPSPSFFGGGNGSFQFLNGSSSFGGGGDPAFSTGPNYVGGGISGVLPFSTGPGFFEASSNVPPFSQFLAGSTSLGGGTGLTFSTWSIGSSSTSVAGALPFPTGSSSFSGALPPFPGEVSSSGHGDGGGSGSGNGVSFHAESSSFGRGSGGGGGGAMPPIGPSSSGRGRGRPPGSRGRGRRSNRGRGRGS